ncbi:MAG: family 1 glycosylhydrolase [Chloroflexota bacterium]|nr:family 1 glycosylhydrolase [Chloroflexota bacterium]
MDNVAQGIRAITGGEFMFATGIECSYPTVVGRDGRRKRIDELEKCFHYKRWRDDLRLVRELGIRYLRYGPPYYSVHRGPGSYDWSFTDEAFAEMRRLGIEPIADLCHFGVPDWIENFQNPEWPSLFAEYAGAFARRYPWVRLYTPVNEIFVCAKLSALHGFWNEQLHSEESFVTALKHLCRANLLAVQAILHERGDAFFIQSESAEYFHEGCRDPDMVAKADFENQRSFLSFDLLYSHQVRPDIRDYLRRCGLDDAEYSWFMNHGLSERIIMGNDFYRQNEQILMPGNRIEPAGDVFGWYIITREYYERYGRPIMHTETNCLGSGADDAPRWLWRQFLNVRLLLSEGAPVLGFTWYSLIDQMDWDIDLRDELNMVNPVGLFDMDRRPRPVAATYRRIIAEYRLPSAEC